MDVTCFGVPLGLILFCIFWTIGTIAYITITTIDSARAGEKISEEEFFPIMVIGLLWPALLLPWGVSKISGAIPYLIGSYVYWVAPSTRPPKNSHTSE